MEDKPGVRVPDLQHAGSQQYQCGYHPAVRGREGTKDISFTVAEDELGRALEVLEEHKEALTIKEITYNAKVAKISVVGAGMMSNPGVAAKMFESLYNSHININMISTSEIRITVLIDEKDIDEAMNAVHEGFALALVE